MVDTDELLRNHIARILAELVEGSQDKKKAQLLIDDLVRAQRRLAVGEVADDRFALCPRAIDAVVKFLTEKGAPATEEEIIRALLAGGFRGGKKENARTIHNSIAIFLNGTGKSTETLKRINGLIGLFGWPEDRFG